MSRVTRRQSGGRVPIPCIICRKWVVSLMIDGPKLRAHWVWSGNLFLWSLGSM